MFVDMQGAGCAECGRPVAAWVNRAMWPCGCPAGTAGPPLETGAVVALPVPRRAPEVRAAGRHWAASA
jgi:hypothetical protein